MKITIGVSLTTFLALASPIAANAESITYDFTGTVSTATGVYKSLAVGSTVTGTYTIDYANAMAIYSYGTVGQTTANWQAETYLSASVGSPPPPLVFSSTLLDGSFSYSTNPAAGTNFDKSYLLGQVSGQYDAFAASETWSPASGTSNTSGFQFLTPYSAFFSPVAPWTSAGQPIFLSSNVNLGNLAQVDPLNGQSELDYTFTSFAPAPVPLPAALWMMISGLGGLGVLMRRRSV